MIKLQENCLFNYNVALLQPSLFIFYSCLSSGKLKPLVHTYFKQKKSSIIFSYLFLKLMTWFHVSKFLKQMNSWIIANEK